MYKEHKFRPLWPSMCRVRQMKPEDMTRAAGECLSNTSDRCDRWIRSDGRMMSSRWNRRKIKETPARKLLRPVRISRKVTSDWNRVSAIKSERLTFFFSSDSVFMNKVLNNIRN
jgi:hypothetical protein